MEAIIAFGILVLIGVWKEKTEFDIVTEDKKRIKEKEKMI